jgi:protein-disulfide isomerase
MARLAQEVGADLDAYQECMEAGEAYATVEARVQEAFSLGFGGTPSFQFQRVEDGGSFQLVGAQPFDEFSNLISALLAGETPGQAQAGEPAEPEGAPFWATAEGLAPDPERPGRNVAGNLYRGNPDAPVVVVEYTDYQCPFCRRHVEQTQPTLDEQFVDTGRIMWVYKHFPLNIHPQAPAAGVAAECAAEQGEFWEMHHLLFGSVDSWSISDPNPVFLDLAADLELDVDQFNSCLNEPEMAARVQGDLADGAPFVRGTPTFIVLFNGQGSIIPGALPVDRFSSVLEEILAEAQ